MEIAKAFPVSGIMFERRARIDSKQNSNFPAVAASSIRCHRRSRSREENREVVWNNLACSKAFQMGYGEVGRYTREQKLLHRGLGLCCVSARASEAQDSVQTAEELREQLESLQEEAEQARGRGAGFCPLHFRDSARARFIRLTDAVEQIRQRAALDVRIGNEASARLLLIEKQKVMKALKAARQRAELLEQLGSKLNVAISRKEMQLIAALSCARVDLDRETSDETTVRVVSPREEGEEASRALDTDESKHCDDASLTVTQGLGKETSPVSTNNECLSVDDAGGAGTSPQDATIPEYEQENADLDMEDSTSSVKQLVVPTVDMDDDAPLIKPQGLGTETNPVNTNQENLSLDDAEAASTLALDADGHECGQENRGLGSAYNEDSTSSVEQLIVPTVDTDADNGSSGMDRRPFGSGGLSGNSELSLSQELAEAEILGKALDNDFDSEHPERPGESWMDSKESDTALNNDISKLRTLEETLDQLEESSKADLSRFNAVVQNVVNEESGADDIIDTEHATKSEEIQDVASRSLDVQVGSMERESWVSKGVAYDVFMQKLHELLEQAEFQLHSFLKVGEVGEGDEDLIRQRVETLSKLLEQPRSMRGR